MANVKKVIAYEAVPVSDHKYSGYLQDIVMWKGELYFVDEPTEDPAALPGSLIAFSRNGVLQGVAYR